MITPGDLLNRKFEKAKVGGYKTADVDSFMVDVASQLSQHDRDLTELKRKNETLAQKVAQYESDQESLKEALLNAQKFADKITKDAKSHAELTIRDAQIKAEEIIENTQSEVVRKQDELARMKKEVTLFRSKLLNIYRAHLELISQIPSEEKEEKQDMPEDARGKDLDPAAKEDKADQEPLAQAQSQAAAAQPEPKQPEAKPAEEPKEPEKAAKGFDVKLNVKYDEQSGAYIPFDSNQNH